MNEVIADWLKRVRYLHKANISWRLRCVASCYLAKTMQLAIRSEDFELAANSPAIDNFISSVLTFSNRHNTNTLATSRSDSRKPDRFRHQPATNGECLVAGWLADGECLGAWLCFRTRGSRSQSGPTSSGSSPGRWRRWLLLLWCVPAFPPARAVVTRGIVEGPACKKSKFQGGG